MLLSSVQKSCLLCLIVCPSLLQLPYSKKLSGKSLVNEDCRKFGRKVFGGIEVHLHRECYGNCENWQKNLANYCNLPNSPKFFPANGFTVRYATVHIKFYLMIT